jgi:hypothetical protein
MVREKFSGSRAFGKPADVNLDQQRIHHPRLGFHVPHIEMKREVRLRIIYARISFTTRPASAMIEF